MKRRTVLFTTLAAAVLMAGCGKADEPAQNSQPPVTTKNVAVTKVTRSLIEDHYEATGTVKAKTTTQVAANMMGRIISFPVSEGDTVTRGQVLVEIDDRESRAQLQKAEAGLREAQAGIAEIERSVEAADAAVKTAEANKQLAEATFGRYKELYSRRSATAQEFDEAQSRLKMATSELDRARAGVQVVISKRKQIKARIEQAKADIANSQVYAGYSRIVAPVSGIVVKKYAEAGATAGPGVPLLSLEDNSQYRLEVGVEESRSRSIRVGGRVTIRIDAIGQGEFNGTIAEIMPTSDAASRSYTVKIDLPANAALRTGLYGVAKFPVAQKEALTVPASAIVERGQLTGVLVVGADGIAQFRIITVGKKSEGMVEVLSGVAEGDDVVSSDAASITEGTKVR